MFTDRTLWQTILGIALAAAPAPLFAEDQADEPQEPLAFIPDDAPAPIAEAPELGDALELPEWVDPGTAESEKKSITEAFNFKRPTFERDDRPTAPKPRDPNLARTDDIGVLLSSATDLLTEPSPGELVDQLERAASDARNLHALGRLIVRCRTLADSEDFVAHAGDRDSQRLGKVAAWAHDARGRMRAASGDHRAALADFKMALRYDHQCYSALHNRAISLAEAGLDDRALEDFTRLLEHDPASTSALKNRSQLLLRLRQPERALGDCDRALRRLGEDTMGPSVASLHALRGRILQELGDLHAATVALDQALEHAPRDARYFEQRGNIHAEGGDYPRAVTDFLTAVHCDPSSADAYSTLAWVLATCPDEQLWDPEMALESAKRARRLSPREDQRSLEAAAAAYAANGRFDEAIRLQQRAVLAAGDSAPNEMHVRLVSYQEGQPYVEPNQASGVIQAGGSVVE